LFLFLQETDLRKAMSMEWRNVDGMAEGARFTEFSGIAVDQTGVTHVTDQRRI
jgi:hypothetical protein